MVQENEIVALLLGFGAFAFILANHAQVRGLAGGLLLVAAFFVDLAGHVFTVAEGFFLRDLLNVLEHLCYAGSAVLLAAWCFHTFRQGKAAP
jgi:hypothetical protein